MEGRTRKLADECVKRAKAHWGPGWENLSQDMRQAYVARQCLSLFLVQDESCMTADAFRRLSAVAEEALSRAY